jgi:nitrite reductase/ring-hydroxylating ferredoxin subunit/uncharacterized membrane protein
MIDPRQVGERLEAAEALDRVAAPAHRAVTRVLPKGAVKDVLHGVWLGHPLHPSLTDLPIGFWTSAFVLDVLGGRSGRRAADTMVGLGVAAALPTAAAGLADWSELNTPERRSGLVHAAANLAATGLYAMSLVARCRGRRARGIVLSTAGAAAATVGGFLGGHLTFRRASGVNQTADVPSGQDWAKLTVEGTINASTPTLADLDGTPLATVIVDDAPTALYDRCSHLGGPLHEGDVVDGCLRCPWHGSTFRAVDGAVVHGPATAPQPAYEVRVDDDRRMARRRQPAR